MRPSHSSCKPDLCHHAAGPGELRARPPLDRWVTQVRDALDQLQRGVPAPIDGAFAVLDDVRRELDAAGLAFGRADETVRADLRIASNRWKPNDGDPTPMGRAWDQQVTRLECENAQYALAPKPPSVVRPGLRPASLAHSRARSPFPRADRTPTADRARASS